MNLQEIWTYRAVSFIPVSGLFTALEASTSELLLDRLNCPGI